MTLAQAKKLKVGDPVIWPEGANGCTYDFSFVKEDKSTGNLLGIIYLIP